jgi:membrane fusion protein (multidrug efflux system)
MRRTGISLLAGLLLAAGGAAWAQQPAPAPAVGVAKVERQPITPASEFVGRIHATDRVELVARVTAYLNERLFTEGAEVRKGDLLYRLEQGPFRADVEAKQAAVAQVEAQLKNAQVTLYRAKALLQTPAGQQSTVDAALASAQSLEAQLDAAKAQLEQSKINLGYTEIRAPIAGKIGRSSVTPGNVVSPGSGVLATIVSQDPMNVVFPVSVPTALDLRKRYAGNGGMGGAVVKVRLPGGRVFDQTGRLDFLDNTIAANTDTIMLRGVLPNPLRGSGDGSVRELVDNELVTVILEDAHPVEALTVPRAAVLADQRGDYVYVVDAQDKAQQVRVELGQSSPTTAVVTSGLKGDETVIVEGLQRVRSGEKVAPAEKSVQPAEGSPGNGAAGASEPSRARNGAAAAPRS